MFHANKKGMCFQRSGAGGSAGITRGCTTTCREVETRPFPAVHTRLILEGRRETDATSGADDDARKFGYSAWIVNGYSVTNPTPPSVDTSVEPPAESRLQPGLAAPRDKKSRHKSRLCRLDSLRQDRREPLPNVETPGVDTSVEVARRNVFLAGLAGKDLIECKGFAFDIRGCVRHVAAAYWI